MKRTTVWLATTMAVTPLSAKGPEVYPSPYWDEKSTVLQCAAMDALEQTLGDLTTMMRARQEAYDALKKDLESPALKSLSPHTLGAMKRRMDELNEQITENKAALEKGGTLKPLATKECEDRWSL